LPNRACAAASSAPNIAIATILRQLRIDFHHTGRPCPDNDDEGRHPQNVADLSGCAPTFQKNTFLACLLRDRRRAARRPAALVFVNIAFSDRFPVKHHEMFARSGVSSAAIPR